MLLSLHVLACEVEVKEGARMERTLGEVQPPARLVGLVWRVGRALTSDQSRVSLEKSVL